MNTEPEKTNEQLQREIEELRQENERLKVAVKNATEQMRLFVDWARKVEKHYNKLSEKITNSQE
jgi:FtsZ-binding cell division protein ZapB